MKVMVVEKKRVTIREVAKEAGVSTQTVSRVINNRPDVAENTRLHVQQVIAKLGYRPDPIARSLKGNSHTLGCITPGLADPIFSMIVEYAQAEARSQGFFFLIGSAETYEEVELLLTEMLNRRVEGLLVINPKDDDRHALIRKQLGHGFPVVYLKNTPGGDHVSAVSMDDIGGSLLATKYLIGLGHKRIAMILGSTNEECVTDRLTGYKMALSGEGIAFDPELVVKGAWSPKSGQDATAELFEKGVDFSAIFAQNDRMAAGSIRMLRILDKHVPEDISVIGYDDIPLASYFDPPLTTIRQPMDQFGSIGADLLIKAVKNSEYQPQAVKLEPELIERDTCAPFQKQTMEGGGAK
jgi:DNA-binding LacI/PurR family transcriptional regulator